MLLLTHAVLTLAASTACADRLVSRHYEEHSLSKRFIDSSGNLNLSIIHTNDIHAHLDEFRSGGSDCRPTDTTCFGGYARIKAKVDELRNSTKANSTLLLDAGDQFQGTIFYTYYKGEKIAETINQLGYDAATLGNHEFDGGDVPLAAYLRNLTFPIISANVQSEQLDDILVPYHVFPQWDIAVVSVLTPDTKSISNPDDSTTFSDPVTAIQSTVDKIRSTENVTRIIALTHIGYDEDIRLAQNTRGFSLIIGGHSHTPLGNISEVASMGNYPTIATNLDGDEVFVVTAWRWGQVLGHIEVAWTPAGKIVSYEGAPIRLNTNTTKQDAKLDAQIQSWRLPFADFVSEVFGVTTTRLDQETCRAQECNMGNLMTDAIVRYRNNGTHNTDGALINAGGIRASIDAGNITRGDAITVFPFGNAIVDLQFTGAELIQVFEKIASNQTISPGQISKEIRYTYNPSNPVGTRLISLTIGGAPVNRTNLYTISTLDFMASGGDNFFTKTATAVLDAQDEVLIAYITENTPITVELDGRIATTTNTTSLSANGTTTSETPSSGNSAISEASPFSWVGGVVTAVAVALALSV